VWHAVNVVLYFIVSIEGVTLWRAFLYWLEMVPSFLIVDVAIILKIRVNFVALTSEEISELQKKEKIKKKGENGEEEEEEEEDEEDEEKKTGIDLNTSKTSLMRKSSAAPGLRKQYQPTESISRPPSGYSHKSKKSVLSHGRMRHQVAPMNQTELAESRLTEAQNPEKMD
jgi:hypothetical protein